MDEREEQLEILESHPFFTGFVRVAVISLKAEYRHLSIGTVRLVGGFNPEFLP
jgi:hypothetical protein